MAGEALPSADEFFSAGAPVETPDAPEMTLRNSPMPAAAVGAVKPLPSADEFFGSPTDNIAARTDREIQRSMLSVFGAFGYGAQHAFGTDPIGLTDETIERLKQDGIFNDFKSGRDSFFKAVVEGVMRSSAAGWDVAQRGVTAAGAGALQATGQALEETHLAERGSLTGEGGLAGAMTDPGVQMALFPELAGGHIPDVDLARARASRVIGEGEAGWKGTAAEAPKAVQDARQAAAESEAIHGGIGFGAGLPEEPASAVGATPEAATHDIHSLARQIEPEAFREYDDLTAKRDLLRRQIFDLGETRAESEPVKAAQERIDTILGKVNGVEDRLTKAAAGRLEDARAEREQFLSSDTAEMKATRDDLQKLDYRMRDLSTSVTRAYREAESQLPAAVEETPAASVAEAVPEANAPAIPAQAETPAPQEPATPQRTIAADVSQKLVSAGRPQEEADAAAALVQAHYEARAARFGGKKGTAQEMYERDGADIQGAENGGRKGGAAGKTVLKDGRATITLFGKADASTMVHETGHHWLNELLSDAGEAGAPSDLVADAVAVRKWLGAEQGEIPTRAHEKFARGFERYLMEGTAPSRELATVFAKFRDWLTKIYQTVARLRAPITDDIRAVFDRLLAEKPERTVIAPERKTGQTLADLHEADAETTPAEHAGKVADHGDAEIEKVTQEKAPEHADEIRGPAGGGKSRGISASDTGVSGGPTAPKPTGGEAGNAAPTGAKPAGNDQAAQEGAGARKKPAASPYLKLPQEPQRLASFVKARGGITDVGGDVRHILGGAKQRPGLISKSGLDTDAMALRAWESGYFPELRERPTVQQFVARLEDDLRGDAQYSEHDADAVQEFRASVQYNAELDRLATDSGVDPAGKTHEEFWNAISEHLSLEEMAREQKSQADAFEKEYSDAQREARAFTESRGDAWEGDAAPQGIGRTLEDLENEHRSEVSSQQTQPGESGAQRSKPAGPDQGQVQEGNGPRGRGARTGSSDQAQANPNTRLSDPESTLVDKAGNIRVENLNTSADVENAIREMADQNEGFTAARRGVVSDAEVLDLADAMGLKPEDLDVGTLRQNFSAERIVASRKLLVQTASDARALAAAAADGSDAQVLAYAEARSRLRMVQEYVSAITAEAGRGLRAFRRLDGVKNVTDAMGDMSEARTLFQMRAEAKRVASLDTAAKVSGFMRDADKPGIGAMLLEAYTNWLISGPLTHMGYSVGNTLLALWRAVPETIGEAAAGAIREGTTGQRGDRVRLGEVGAQLYGMVRGQRNGVQAAWDAFKTGQTSALPGEGVGKVKLPFTPTRAIPGVAGAVIRVPGERMIAPIHSYFRSIGYSQSIARQAYRAAATEGLTGDAFNARIAELTRQPTEAMMSAAREDATQQTLMGKGGGLTQKVSALMNWEPNVPGLGPTRLLRFIDPFVHIASNIVEQSVLERGPLGVLATHIREDISGKNGPLAQDAAIAKMAVGTSLSIVGGGLAMEGIITPSAPADPKEAAVWNMVNGLPHAIRIGDMAFDISRLGPLGFQLGIAADLYHAAEEMGKDDITKVGSLLVHSFTQNFLDEGFMRGPSDLIKALDDPDRYGQTYIKNFISTAAVPFSVGMGQVARQIDPYSREARTLLDSIKAKIPGVSETLFPRRDLWGQEIPNREWAVVYSQRVQNDPVNRALTTLGYFPARPEHRIRGIELTGQQYDDFSRIAGRTAKLRLNAIVGQRGFMSLPPEVQLNMVQSAVKDSREMARDMVMMRNPQIVKQAHDAKVAPLKKAAAR